MQVMVVIKHTGEKKKMMMHLKLEKQEPRKGKQGLDYVCNKTFGD